ncbi:hypothetical protein M5689_014770 [Euphorbia peplus]|nr:hypothetical protein M5689_014770 [Euphorbia peplus]
MGTVNGKNSCKCGDFAVERVSWTSANPGRRFFGCKHYETTKPSCGYHSWIDEQAPRHYRNVMNGLLNDLKEKDRIIVSQKKLITGGGEKPMNNNGMWVNCTVTFVVGVTLGGFCRRRFSGRLL